MKKILHLSDEWIKELNNVAQSHKGLEKATTDVELVVEYRVMEKESITWQILINKGEIEIKPIIEFGWMMSLGLITSFIITFTLLPTILNFLSTEKTIIKKTRPWGNILFLKVFSI